MQRMGAAITEFRRGVLLKPVKQREARVGDRLNILKSAKLDWGVKI